jgi:hypothetical protein
MAMQRAYLPVSWEGGYGLAHGRSANGYDGGPLSWQTKFTVRRHESGERDGRLRGLPDDVSRLQRLPPGPAALAGVPGLPGRRGTWMGRFTVWPATPPVCRNGSIRRGARIACDPLHRRAESLSRFPAKFH